MSENLDFENLDNEEMQHISEAALPYATATLVLGILSIVTCWLYGIWNCFRNNCYCSSSKK